MGSWHVWIQSFIAWIGADYSDFVIYWLFGFAVVFESQARGLSLCSFSVINCISLIGCKCRSLPSGSFSINLVTMRLKHLLQIAKRPSGMVPFLVMSNQLLDLVGDHSLLFLLDVRHHSRLAKVIWLDWRFVFEGISVENKLVIFLSWGIFVVCFQFQNFESFWVFYRVCDARENVLLRVILYTLMLMLLNVNILNICHRRVALMRALNTLVFNRNHILVYRRDFPVCRFFSYRHDMALILGRERVSIWLLTSLRHPEILSGWSSR